MTNKKHQGFALALRERESCGCVSLLFTAFKKYFAQVENNNSCPQPKSLLWFCTFGIIDMNYQRVNVQINSPQQQGGTMYLN
jgi:hypothetical protein